MPKVSLRAARVNAKLTQSYVASQLGVNGCTVSNWESGRTYPSVKEAVQLCKLYGLTMNDIIFCPDDSV